MHTKERSITSKQPCLLFIGTVKAIHNAPLKNSLANWIVVFTIEQVLAGQFQEREFSFRMHSPSRSGLTVNKRYRVEADKTESGYEVDQYQWISQ